MTTQSPVIDELLNDRSHHIEFNGHLTNHVKHAVVALARLDASPGRIKEYYDTYAKLTPYGYGLEAPKPDKHIITDANWRDFRGKRSSWSSYCDFFERKQRELGTDELLRRYVPPLLAGWAGAFTHATIHLGWALDVNSPRMVVEGLAYMVFSEVSCHPERALPARADPPRDEGVVDSLLRIAGIWEANHAELHSWAETLVSDLSVGLAAGIHPELARSGLQYRIARMLSTGHPLMYELPAWIESQSVSTTWAQLYEGVTLLYLAQPGDFVLIHFITSLLAMERIAEHLPEEHHREVIKCFWIGILGVLFSRADFPKRSVLAALRARYQDAVDDLDAPSVKADWEQIRVRAIAEEEEHNPKMVYVLQREWRRTGGRTLFRATATHFTTTPELPKSFEEAPHE
ncbi:MAG: questin oxidase family protein [Cystobacter sp.]